MKKSVLFLFVIVLSSIAFGQSQDYNVKMAEKLSLFKTSKTVAEFQVLASTFVVISKAEEKEWLPLYYAAMATILMTQSETDDDKIDIYLDQAQKYLDMATKIKNNEAEILILQGLLHQSRIKVSPMSRGQKYSMLANEVFEKAKLLNAENPRIYYLEAMNTFNTPKMFGGGKKNALPLFQKADEKFNKFEPESQISPNWGKENNQKLLNICLN